MTDLQIPPEGVPAEFTFNVPAPAGMTTVGGIKVRLTFVQGRPQGFFSAALYVDGEPVSPMDGGAGPDSAVHLCQIQDGAVAAPARVRVVLNDGSHLDPGNTVTVTAWGAQTEKGVGALNPDPGNNPTVLTGPLQVGTVEVLDWPEWNRLTGANQGQEEPGS